VGGSSAATHFLLCGTGFTGAEERSKGLRILPASHVRTTFGCFPSRNYCLGEVQ
jgi:hypothetical protein